jgi:hypothetical protein
MDDTKLSQTYNIRLEETFKANNSEAMWELVNVVKPVDGKLVTKAPTQHEFLKTLQGLTGIWIRGSYFAGSEATWLKNVRIVRGSLTKVPLPSHVLATRTCSSPPTSYLLNTRAAAA